MACRARGRVWAILLVAAAAACGRGTPEVEIDVSLESERYHLENGMEVVLHVDRSDPIAAVVMTFHVGSARETPGRTGFAHLFEHLFFLDSENLGPGGLDRLMTRIGSSTNGSTSRDRTNYFEVVPIDALEKALWAESDKLGWFINTVTDDVLAKEKQVVKNEKRQFVDNVPYGHASYVIDRALYPDGHPYQWQVIGSLEDLDAATLEDVHAFHHQWYGPENLTLVVAGDIDVETTKAWIERYFGEVPMRGTPPERDVPEVVLEGDIRLFHEDNFARLPQLQIAWPTVPRFHDDQYALDILARLLTDGRNAPLYQTVVEEFAVAPGVGAGHGPQELAGRMTLTVRAFPDVPLDSVAAAVEAGFARFEERGVVPEELARVLAGLEADAYRGLSSNLGKAFQLADYALFAGTPDFLRTDLGRALAVTADDVLDVYDRYVSGRPRVEVSFVPRGRPELALGGSMRADVVEEPIVQGAEDPVVVTDRGDIARTPSRIDRSVEPPFGPSPVRRAPTVWEGDLANRVRVLGIEDHETPLVQFELRIRGGQLVEAPGRVGVANLLAETMMAGTARRTPAELEQALDMLGATLSVSAGREAFVLRGSTLARNWDATVALLEEVLLEPRFDPQELELARQRVRNALEQQAANPGAVAANVFASLLYGDHILAENGLGSPELLETVTMEDIRAYYANRLAPALASFHVAGAVPAFDVVRALRGIEARWQVEPPSIPGPPSWDPERAGVYFVDVPNASQSVLQVGYLGLRATDPDFWPATVMNFRFGGGGFASDLVQVLRESRGYAYSVGARFAGSDMPGPFQVSSSVRSNVTLEALQDIRDIMVGHGPGFGEDDLEETRAYLLRSNAGAFETLGAKLGLLADVSQLGFPPDYVVRREDALRDFTVEQMQDLAQRYLDPAGMIWLIVGDAATQLPRLDALGMGPVTLVDRSGAAVAP